jgi:hypothetical protein
MTNYYQDNLLECDGRTASHPANADVNNEIVPFSSKEMQLNCNCSKYPECLSTSIDDHGMLPEDLKIYPNPASEWVIIQMPEGIGAAQLLLYNSLGVEVLYNTISGTKSELNLEQLSTGIYVWKILTKGKDAVGGKIMIE